MGGNHDGSDRKLVRRLEYFDCHGFGVQGRRHGDLVSIPRLVILLADRQQRERERDYYEQQSEVVISPIHVRAL